MVLWFLRTPGAWGGGFGQPWAGAAFSKMDGGGTDHFPGQGRVGVLQGVWDLLFSQGDGAGQGWRDMVLPVWARCCPSPSQAALGQTPAHPFYFSPGPGSNPHPGSSLGGCGGRTAQARLLAGLVRGGGAGFGTVGSASVGSQAGGASTAMLE